jgi:hypothetical protein
MHMSIRRALALAALVAIVPATAHAQFERSTKLGVFAGATVPVSDFGDYTSTGFNIGALIEMKPALSPVGLRFDGTYHRLGFKTDFTGASGSTSVWNLNANAVLSPAASPIYLIGGAGVYSLTDNYEGSSFKPSSGTKVGFNVGGGLRMPLTGFDTFIEARYHLINMGSDGNASNVKMIPISFGVRF